MLYLGIMLGVAALGLFRLWLIQRKERRADWRDIDNLRASLERLSAQPTHTARPTRSERGRSGDLVKRMSHAGEARLSPLDPARREAAKRRIEARRAARARAAG
ncbi:MAG: hypothetical protein ACRDJ5_02995 [Actinomycetota bacterium]